MTKIRGAQTARPLARHSPPLILAGPGSRRIRKGLPIFAVKPRAGQELRCGNPYLTLLNDSSGLFPDYPSQVEEVLSHGAGHDVPYKSGGVLLPHPDHLGPELTPVWRSDPLPPDYFEKRPELY